MSTAATRARTIRGAAVEIADIANEIGFLRGKMDSMSEQHARMIEKLDRIPDDIREAIKPLADQLTAGLSDHGQRISELEMSAASEKGVSSWRARVFAILTGIAGIAAAVWGIFHSNAK